MSPLPSRIPHLATMRANPASLPSVVLRAELSLAVTDAHAIGYSACTPPARRTARSRQAALRPSWTFGTRPTRGSHWCFGALAPFNARSDAAVAPEQAATRGMTGPRPLPPHQGLRVRLAGSGHSLGRGDRRPNRGTSHESEGRDARLR
jgi:hypothetical protein